MKKYIAITDMVTISGKRIAYKIPHRNAMKAAAEFGMANNDTVIIATPSGKVISAVTWYISKRKYIYADHPESVDIKELTILEP